MVFKGVSNLAEVVRGLAVKFGLTDQGLPLKEYPLVFPEVADIERKLNLGIRVEEIFLEKATNQAIEEIRRIGKEGVVDGKIVDFVCLSLSNLKEAP